MLTALYAVRHCGFTQCKTVHRNLFNLWLVQNQGFLSSIISSLSQWVGFFFFIVNPFAYYYLVKNTVLGSC